VTEGLCLVNAMHLRYSSTTTKRVFITTMSCGWKNQRRTLRSAPIDITGLAKITRRHLKRQIMGRGCHAITKGKLDFGPWEQIFYGEFDGRRKNECS
jgi:hypothetical protein